jgi:hypothetical protein
MSEDEETGSMSVVGALRFWVDITPAEAFYEPAKLTNDSRTFEIRVTIWNIAGISIFQDAGERNDVYVKGKLKTQGPNGIEIVEEQHTDIHKWAHKDACFNFRMVYRVKAPAFYCAIEFGMMDNDKISDPDPIYASKTLNLDHQLMLAFTNALDGREPLGIDSTQIVFDAWPTSKNKKEKDEEEDDEPPKPKGCCRRCCGWYCYILCCCCCCPRRPVPIKAPKPATMFVDVQVLPQTDADLNPVEQGRIGTELPKGRLTWQIIVQDPVRFVKIVMGPKMYNFMIKTCIISLIVSLVLVFLVLSYLIMNTYLLPFIPEPGAWD